MDRRKEELEKKRLKLAELRRAREERRNALGDGGEKRAAEPDALSVETPNSQASSPKLKNAHTADQQNEKEREKEEEPKKLQERVFYSKEAQTDDFPEDEKVNLEPMAQVAVPEAEPEPLKAQKDEDEQPRVPDIHGIRTFQ
ncbi:hypothetical protein HDU96_007851 [Phlyctochytrium bullatum]|nr:hypothetical protein HDU96_007851 [Phlyctochytrium bullatum]